MACSTKLEPPEAILAGFKWDDLPENSVVVDVGGGVGSTALIIANAFPHLSVVVQDRSSVIEDAKITSQNIHNRENTKTDASSKGAHDSAVISHEAAGTGSPGTV
ncbi:hypothetical protein B0H13DRAFT_1903300 [Mycena leptocephala]|nr:hypothetical protein B0H13DRAFT_1903300 [Mycena leptocephala]